MAPRQTDPQYKLRMTPEIKAKLDAAAAASGRSLNAEILFRLEDSFAEHGRDEWRARVDAQDKRLDNLEAFLKSGGAVPLADD